MTKNVTVTDAQGNTIGVTYPKRAKGLIKNGRAIFVDDCTIRLFRKTEPSDTENISEVNQMNYIFFNPRNWSFERMQYNNQNNFGVSGHFSGRTPGFAQPFYAECTFISDFDGGLVESLLFGDWNTPYVRATSNEFSLSPDTDYCFVFWLNGGENDKSNEICQLQIAFFENWDNCYTYKLNRNYIKPLLHKEGWELYSIPFCTPKVSPVPQGTSEPAPTVAARFAFVAGNAPMALKPAKEPDTYADWEDAPDEFADLRPQRHNLVFADGWPSISQYGGNKYSTEALRAQKISEETKQAGRFSSAYHNAAENLGNLTRNAADSIKNAAQNMAQNARRMAENYRNSGSVNWRNAEDTANTANAAPMPGVPPMPVFPAMPLQGAVILSADLAEQLEDLKRHRDDMVDQRDDLQERLSDLKPRAEDLSSEGLLNAEAYGSLTARFSAFELELGSLESQLSSIDIQVDTAQDVLFDILSSTGLEEQGKDYLDSLERTLDTAEGYADILDSTLDSLEEYLDTMEGAFEEE